MTNHGSGAPRGRRGFSFTEVLFAVMTLGLGFIMIAAIFPITIRQTQTTMEESAGAAVAQQAIAFLETLASDVTMPPNLDGLQPFDPGDVGGEQIVTADPRYAWVAFYRRGVDGTEGLAQVFVVVVRARNAAAFGPDDLTTDSEDVTGGDPNLAPRGVGVTFDEGVDGRPDRVRLTGGEVNDTKAAAAVGAYLVAGDDQVGGRIYRLGNPVDEAAGVWELMPGADLAAAGGAASGGSGLLVGRGYAEPGRPGSGFAGPAQDVALYTAVLRIAPE